MKDLAELRATALDLAAQFQMPAAEVASRIARATDAAYWTSLSPDIQIDSGRLLAEVAVDPREQSACERFFNEEGYFQSPLLLPAESLAALNGAIDAVTAAGWPPLFAIVSDGFWQCSRLAALRGVMTSLLGPGYRQIPHLWLHVVKPIDGAGGWPPHFDGFRATRVSVWLALTDATTDNGCMFLIPPKQLPDSFRTLDTAPPSSTDVSRAMHATRALPVRAGTALGWHFDVFHWGGRAVNPQGERRALSLEFLAGAEQAREDEHPLLEVDGPLPSFSDRLNAIAIGLEMYGKREPLSQRFRALIPDLKAPR